MTSTTYHVRGMDCKSCATTLENGLIRLDGVQGVQIDFMNERVTVTGDVPLASLQERAQLLGGYEIHATAHRPDNGERVAGGVVGFLRYLLREPSARYALVGGGITLLTVLSQLMGMPGRLASYGYLLGTVIAAIPISRSGLTTLWINRSFNLNLLMTIAAVGAVVIGETLEAAIVVFLYAVGEALEGFTADRARDSIRALAELTPLEAHRVEGDNLITVPVEALRVGDHILVKAGERIPMDGDVLNGVSGVNQAPITGESMPVNKQVGDEVYAGSINGDGSLTIEITALAADNTLNRIIKLVEEAQTVQSPSQRRVDQFASYYTPLMTLAALLVAVVPPLFFGAPFFEPASGGHGWLYRALAMLMIACPCALVISTPVTVVSAITHAARHGVLIKGGLHLETLGRVRAIAFDKTGTLTQGTPTVQHYRAVNCADDDGCPTCEEMLALAASVEQQSTHPLALAVVGAAGHTYPAQNVTSLSGRGVQGMVEGRQVTVGSHRYFDEQFPHSSAVCEMVAGYERAGQTAMLVAEGETVSGVITVADSPREVSAAVIRDLNKAGVDTIMLTGDNATVAEVIGARLGVTDIRAGLLPEDKSKAVRDLMTRYGSVAMVGDGVNDTPALAAATVGIAMGGAGSAQAIETADVTLMSDDLTRLPFTLRLSQFANRLISQNIVLSVGVKLLFTVLAIAGFTSLWLAILADVGMLVVVTLNGMRPLRFS